MHKPKMIQLDNKEVSRCIEAFFDAAEKGGFDEKIIAAAVRIMSNVLHERGLRPMIVAHGVDPNEPS